MGTVKAAAVGGEEEKEAITEAGDTDDLAAMMGGMDEEQAYNVTMKDATDAAEGEKEVGAEAGDTDDLAAMMGGMDEEQVYNVTLKVVAEGGEDEKGAGAEVGANADSASVQASGATQVEKNNDSWGDRWSENLHAVTRSVIARWGQG